VTKLYTVTFTDQEIRDLRDALPTVRPAGPVGTDKKTRQWDLDDKLKRLKPDA
jgi:hypothetical protein